MTITIEAPFSISDTDKESINGKLRSLLLYDNRITQVNVFFKKDDGTAPNAILADIRVRIPGEDIFTEDSNSDFMKAFSSAFNSSKRHVRKNSERLKEHHVDIRRLNEDELL